MSLRTVNFLFVVAVLMGAVGWWLPYAQHSNGAAALVLLGLDLGDFWKFTNEWRVQGLFANERLFFFLPPALAAIMLSLWLALQRGRWRWFFLPLLLFLGLVILPAVDVMMPLLLPGNPFVFEEEGYAREYTFQLWLCVATLFSIAAIPLWQRLPLTVIRGLLVLLGVLGAILPAYALWSTWLVLAGFYGQGLVAGAGIIVTTIGFGAAVGLALGLYPPLNEKDSEVRY
jgi:hypothetical protein